MSLRAALIGQASQTIIIIPGSGSLLSAGGLILPTVDQNFNTLGFTLLFPNMTSMSVAHNEFQFAYGGTFNTLDSTGTVIQAITLPTNIASLGQESGGTMNLFKVTSKLIYGFSWSFTGSPSSGPLGPAVLIPGTTT